MNRQIKTCLLTLLVSVFSVYMYAGDTGKFAGVSTPTHKGRLERVNNPNRKRAPSRDFIEYEYTGQGIMFYPMSETEIVEVTITGADNFTNITEITSVTNGYFVETGILNGVYNIQCTTESNTTYYGTLEI